MAIDLDKLEADIKDWPLDSNARIAMQSMIARCRAARNAALQEAAKAICEGCREDCWTWNEEDGEHEYVGEPDTRLGCKAYPIRKLKDGDDGAILDVVRARLIMSNADTGEVLMDFTARFTGVESSSARGHTRAMGEDGRVVCEPHEDASYSLRLSYHARVENIRPSP